MSVLNNVNPNQNFERVLKAINEIRQGRMVILVDDEDRENEGDLVMAAELVRSEDINFMAKYARGLICLSMTEERLKTLDIPMMVDNNTSSFQTAFTVSIEARQGVSTGISAADRAHTIRLAMNDHTQPQDLVRPGHVFPLRAKKGGVLVRTGQTEGSVDLARLAGLKPAGVICEIMNDDGTMARRTALEEFARTHGLMILTVAELIAYRLYQDRFVYCLKSFSVTHQTLGAMQVHVYGTDIDKRQHLAVVFGKPDKEQVTLVRVQSGTERMHYLSALFCNEDESMMDIARFISRRGGVLVHLCEESPESETLLQSLSRLLNKSVTATMPVDNVFNEPSMPLREIGIGAQILKDLGVFKMALLTQHKKKLPALDGFGLVCVEQVPWLS